MTKQKKKSEEGREAGREEERKGGREDKGRGGVEAEALRIKRENRLRSAVQL